MSSLSTDQNSSSDGNHSLKVMLDDNEILSVSVGFQIMGKAPDLSTNLLDQVKSLVTKQLGLEKLFGDKSSSDASASEAQPA